MIFEYEDDILKLLQEIYDQYGFTDAVGLSFFKRFHQKIEEFDIVDLIALQITNYPSRFVFDFLLSTPSLLSKMSDLDWIKVMNFVNPRPDPIKFHDDHSHFADIHFLCKYLKIDALNFFLRQDDFSNLNKQNVLKYCRREAHSFFLDEFDLEDLDGDYFMSLSEIEGIRLSLGRGERFLEFNYTEYTLIKYIEELQKSHYLCESKT